MTAMLIRDSNTITIATFYENYLLNKYNFEPPYQRHSIWSEDKQSFLIDSILKNFPIPPIFLHQHIDEATGKTSFDVIDGKQRLISITKFINNEIPVSNEFAGGEFDDEALAGKYFRDLDAPALSEYKKRFWRYIVPIEYVDTVSKQVIDNIFDRLNRNGEPLTGQELRNAQLHNSELLSTIRQLAKIPFWANRLQHVDRARMEDDEFISELVFVLLESSPLEADQALIDELYQKYSPPGRNWTEVKDQFFAITNNLEGLELDYDGLHIKGVSHLYALWCLGWSCWHAKIDPKQIAGKVQQFYVDLRGNQSSNASVQEYKKSMSSRTKAKIQRVRRLEALKSYLGI